MTIREAVRRGWAEILYVCVRAEHHRHRVAGAEPGEHRGCAAYCPAGALDGHEWLPCNTDLERLISAGIASGEPAEARRGREILLIR